MYSFDSRIRYSEVDENGYLTIEKLIDYFQDCSTFQSEFLGVGTLHLRERNLVWVVNSWQIEIERLPKLTEKVTIGTFPYDFKGFMGYRNFFMQDEEGNYIAKANTLWVLLDSKTGKPTRPDDEHRNKYICEEKLPMEYGSRKVTIPEEMEKGEAVEIKKHHLDTNHHVNNGQYVKICMDSLGEEVKNISRFKVEYRKQAFLGDALTPYVGERALDDGKVAKIVRLDDQNGNPCCVLEIY